MSYLSTFRLASVSGCLMVAVSLSAQQPPYDKYPDAQPPYYRVRYEAPDDSEPASGGARLAFAVNYTIWIPPTTDRIRGVIVHQHGCGEGSCSSGLTGAFDLHWQALARKHDCALLAPSYEQPQGADCQLWCDPRNGSGEKFQQGLADLGLQSGHPELAQVPWALWGHSGGGHWAGGMVMVYPDRVAAAWLRSGVPLFKENPDRPLIKPHRLPEAALKVPMMCNPGTKEGVTVKDGRFARVWPANEAFFYTLRERRALVGVAVDPLTAHECGNQRYCAIRWLDECLTHRLSDSKDNSLREMPTGNQWLAAPVGTSASPHDQFKGDPQRASWLPGERFAKIWSQYVKDTMIGDDTPPPAPYNVTVSGNTLTWDCDADLESGLAHFFIIRDGRRLAKYPPQAKNRFGRPIFQNLQYSDTPTQPLVPMRFTDETANSGEQHRYRVVAVNTVGLKSELSAAAKAR